MEAIANAAEHAYTDHTDGPGLMRIEAHHTTGYILVIVSDQGSWRTPNGTIPGMCEGQRPCGFCIRPH